MALKRNVGLKGFRYRGGGPMWAWILHRVSGLAMVLFVGMHILASFSMQQFAGDLATSINIVYESVYFQIFVFFIVLYHGLNGLRIIILDTWPQLLEYQRILGEGWLTYQQHQGAHAAVLKEADLGFTRPWLAINYANHQHIQPLTPSTGVPVIFLEPFRIDYAELLAPLKEVPALFVFETRAKLIQLLQFPAVIEALCMPHHVVYVMEVYPNSQFAVQDLTGVQGPSFDFFCTGDRPALRSALPPSKHLSAPYLTTPSCFR